MTKKKTSFLPKVEVLIILVFFLSFMVWAISKCGETKALYQSESPEDTETVETPASVSTSTPSDSLATTPPQTTNNNTTTTPQITTNASSLQNRSTPLYVTIDGLNMRTGPSLDSTVILKLKLFDQVNFMGEVTDSTYQISLGYEIADEPWVKVQHKRGRIGWVYGAGVNYYKKKRGE